MRKLTNVLARWATPIYVYYDWKLRWENGNLVRKLHTRPATEPVTVIASQAQAYALQRKVLKQGFRFFAAASSNPWIGKYWPTQTMRQMVQIEPGAAYFYAEAHLGTKKVSRVIPAEVLDTPGELVALNFQMRAEAKGNMVTMEKRSDGKVIATYEKQVYAKVLRIIPKACVEKSKCSNG